MKLTTGILAVVMMAGAAWAQNPDAIDNARSVAKSLQQIQTTKTNAALDAAAGVPAQTSAPVRSCDNGEAARCLRTQEGSAGQDSRDETGSQARGGYDEDCGRRKDGCGRARQRQVRNAAREREEVGDERQARSLLQSGGATADRIRMLLGEEMPGDWADQFAGRGQVGKRLYRGGDQQPEQGVFPARKRSSVQRLCEEHYRRFGCVLRDGPGQAGQSAHARSCERITTPAV